MKKSVGVKGVGGKGVNGLRRGLVGWSGGEGEMGKGVLEGGEVVREERWGTEEEKGR